VKQLKRPCTYEDAMKYVIPCYEKAFLVPKFGDARQYIHYLFVCPWTPLLMQRLAHECIFGKIYIILIIQDWAELLSECHNKCRRLAQKITIYQRDPRNPFRVRPKHVLKFHKPLSRRIRLSEVPKDFDQSFRRRYCMLQNWRNLVPPSY
jgi:hypothetical protein